MPIAETVAPDHIVSLETGQRFKVLERHVRSLGPIADGLPPAMGPAEELSDGGAELCGVS
ncbi:ROS/MUCR transcriptional regulator protein [Aureimonas phyllosphaerae]|uniref:Uncharacterized protein n=1 Tax=Aureimonas phyllosphaerae TaxID=1166078 RepID=A0A7W6BUI3_9HYPH|nr:hypothetical protein [Aureimonas phyllosphaerae]MBB3962248.1 hypothetical protein [Aureimonas phyllosphaerae]SFF59745.1 ROS/MUCR transcriptional regulator protein [Aureimonas phyllosphaerae]